MPSTASTPAVELAIEVFDSWVIPEGAAVTPTTSCLCVVEPSPQDPAPVGAIARPIRRTPTSKR